MSEQYITVEKLVKDAKSKGVDFGKGDPYNRLRYYTKIGWLPHMVRKKDNKGNTVGHYPIATIEKLVQIQEYKDQGYTNDDITQKLSTQERVDNFYSVFKSNEVRTKLITYTSFVMLFLILLVEVGFLQIGKSKDQIIIQPSTNNIEGQVQILDSGTAFIPEEQSQIFVKSRYVFETSKIYVTIKDDYSPATKYWVSQQISNEGFVLQLDAPVFQNTEFDWWVSN